MKCGFSAVSILSLIFTFGVTVSCSRPAHDRSSVLLTMPSHPDVSAKSVNRSLSSSESKFCYFANVLGRGIEPRIQKCAPPLGTHTRFVEPMSSVELQIQRGTDRIVEIYGYLPRAGETCSALPADLSGVPINRVFRMGRAVGVDATREETVVIMSIAFPGVRKHFGVQGNLDESCFANLPAVIGDSDGNQSPIQRGSRFSIHSRISSGASGPMSGPATLVGTSYRISGGVSHVAQ